MSQVTTIMPPYLRPVQHRPAGPIRTPILSEGEDPCGYVRQEEGISDPSRAIMTGQSGVYLTLFYLLLWGVPATPAKEGLPYDLIADVPRLGMQRIQVKATSHARRKHYFQLNRGCHGSKRGVFPYQDGDFDIAALVCLHEARVLFKPAPLKSFLVTARMLQLNRLEIDTFNAALDILDRRALSEQLAWLASMEQTDASASAPSTMSQTIRRRRSRPYVWANQCHGQSASSARPEHHFEAGADLNPFSPLAN